MNDFNLVDEPWIPCLTASGERELLGLSELFAHAHELRDLAAAAPSERVALLRLLIAVHQSATRRPETPEDLHALIDAGRFDDTAGAYLTRWRHRFGLFDGERPFMQPAVLPDVEATTVATLLPEWSSGNNATLVDHHRDDRPPALTPAQAARALLVAQAYQLGGGVAKPFNRTAAPLAAGLVGLLSGETLFHTIVLNAPLYAPEYGRPVHGNAADCPSWERADEQLRRPNKDGTTPDGWLDLLTWWPRAIRLLRDDDGLVRRCVIHQHLRLLTDAVQDPHVPLTLSRDGALVRVRARAGKALWRQADSVLLGLCGTRDFKRSNSIFEELGDLLDDDRVRGIEVTGIVGSQGKIDDWASARFPIGSRLTVDAQDWLTTTLERAAAVATRVRFALQRDRDVVFGGWEVLYWGDLGRRFDPLLRAALRDDASLAALDEAWNAALRRAAHAALDIAFSARVESPTEHEFEAAARRKLNASLAKLLPSPEQEAV